uniref:Nucleotide-diphospho-sugar transferase domain-containing protein n=1 Tax=viral metagenome TaxID=1070528 RepID=A0A6C0LHA0_9ZZZZ
MNINPETGKIIFSALLVSSVIILYFNYSHVEKTDDVEFNLIQQYLVNNSKIARSDKPVLWIHNDYKLNDRNWKSFGSRNTNELNKPIVYLTIDSMIKKCDKSFNICLIDDNSFNNLIPGWNIDLETIPEPNRKNYRQLGFLHLLYVYGGIHVPSSMLCFNNLIDIFTDNVSNDNFFVTESLPTSVLSNQTQIFPTLKIIGSMKNNPNILELLRDLETHYTTSLTNESTFKGSVEKHVHMFALEGKCNIVPGQTFGYFDENNMPISISELMSDAPISLSETTVAIEIPVDEIIENKNRNWMSKLEIDELPHVNNNIGYLLHKQYC